MTLERIQWMPWGDEAFDLARERDVPILLSIGAVWCHWCHVMDQTTFSDEQVVDLVRQLVVPVRVDNDQRPDINARYNMGGWPTVAFLTPEGETMAGGTYMPPEGFASAIRQISDYYRTNKGKIAGRVAQMKAERRLLRLSVPTGGELSLSLVDSVYGQVVSSYDEQYGGFGTQQKFPQSDALELALERHVRTADETALAIVTKTLHSMAEGGLYDHEVGGFFRYSTTRDWSVPHFEKMLEDNARLLSLYLHAYQVTRETAYRETAEGIVGYVTSTLYNQKDGYFYGSQDADERYYGLTKAQRATTRAPFIDTIAYTAWNAMMVRSFIEAGLVLGRPELTQMAFDTLERLWQRCWTPQGGMCQHWREEARLPGWLSAQAWTALACLDAYEAAGAPVWLERARSVLDWTLANLTTPSGALRDMPEAQNALGRLAETEAPLVENAVAVDALIRASRLAGHADYRERAVAILASLQEDCSHLGILAAGYALAAAHLLLEPVQVVLVGEKGNAELEEMREVIWQLYVPNRVLLTLDPTSDQDRLAELGYPAGLSPKAYVCVGTRCLEPANDSRELEAVMARAKV